jgi:hypothetical protein
MLVESPHSSPNRGTDHVDLPELVDEAIGGMNHFIEEAPIVFVPDQLH